MYTITEVAKITGLTVSQIEKCQRVKGLSPKPLTKNNRKYLLYGTKEIQRLMQIKFLKEVKLENKEIVELFEAHKNNEFKILDECIIRLTNERNKLNKLIEMAVAMQETGITPSLLQQALPYDITFNDSENIIKLIYGASQTDLNNKNSNVNEDLLDNFIIEMDTKCKDGEPIMAPVVQKIIASLFNDIYGFLAKENFVLYVFSAYFAPGGLCEEYISEEFGRKTSRFVFEAIQYYINENANEEFAEFIDKYFRKIAYLFKKGYDENSEEIQEVISQCMEALYNIFTKESVLKNLQSAIKYFEQKIVVENFDTIYGKNVTKRFVEAMRIFCTNL